MKLMRFPLLLILVIILFSCLKKKDPPTLTTVSVTAITQISGSSGGNITSDGGATITAKGVCWATTSNPTTANDNTKDGTGTGTFTSKLTGLTAETTYYVRAYATNGVGTSYGNQVTFKTSPAIVQPTVSTTDVSAITQTTASGGGNVTDAGNGTITARGVCWSTTQSPTTANSLTSDGTGTGIFTSSLTGLTAGTTYYVRAYATNSAGTNYGNELSFTTNCAPPSAPVVGTITQPTCAVATGSVALSGLPSSGWTLTRTPGGTTTTGTGTATTVSGLPAGTTYTFTVTNASGCISAGSGNVTISAQPASPSAPVVGTITQPTCAVATGSVALSGLPSSGTWILIRTPGGTTTNGTGTTATVTGLPVATTYTFTVTNASGCVSVASSSVVINPLPSVPAAITNAVTTIGTTYATLNGSVNANGSSTTVTFEYGSNTSYGSTIAASPGTVTGSSNNSVSASIGSLTPGTTYHYRVKAVSCAGTNYGTDQTFTTIAGSIPNLTTTSVTSITHSTAISGGNITSNGGVTITASGICWSTSANPTTSNSRTTDGSVTGTFTSSLTGLVANTTYFVRAYATNSVGTAYGNVISFKTLDLVTDINGNVYNIVVIGSQVWMKENLKVTNYSDGTPIALVEDTASWRSLGSTGKAYCWYQNNPVYGQTYGALYSWAAATNNTSSFSNPSGIQGACPVGWHIPSDDEWKQLELYIGLSQTDADNWDIRGTNEGQKLKSISGWYLNGNGTDDYGFTALPGGDRSQFLSPNEISYSDMGTYGAWWTSSENSSGGSSAISRTLRYLDGAITRLGYLKINAYSVRCIKD